MPQHLTPNDGGRRRRYFYTPLIVLALLALCVSGLHQPAVQAAATFTVNSVGDGADANVGDGVCADASGGCTLRAALQEANAAQGLDTINFVIGSGVQTIVMTSDLPIISDPVVIDGTTQPGFAGAPIIELNGNGVQNRAGLSITAGNSILRGLVMNRFSTAAIGISTGGGNHVEGNYIGTDVTGTRGGGGFQEGISVFDSSGNVIGGTTPAARNVISGNSAGVEVGGSGSGNVIQGNYVGTNAAGTAAIANNVGVRAIGGTDVVVGGTAPGAGNVISGNTSQGLWVGTRWTVQGNYIGTNAAGTAAVPNGEGMEVGQSSGLIGGTTPAARNVISGNNAAGINIVDNATANVVQGNYIGVGADGARPIPNSNIVGNSAGGISFRYAKGNTIGGTAPGAGNVIAFNGTGGGYGGVVVAPFNFNVPNTNSRNTIRGNSIFSNLGPGIDLLPGGVTANDPGDADDGANNLQNFPVLTSVSSAGGETTIQGTLNSKASAAYDLDFYKSGVCDGSGNGEGSLFVGTTSVTTNASGDASFSLTLPFALGSGQVVTATATDSSGNTSEFSACAGAGGAPSGTVQFSASTYNASENVGSVNLLVTRTGGSAGEITVNYSTVDGSGLGGSDYQPVSGSLTFADGDTASKTISVPVINDNVNELNEFFNVSLNAAAGDDRLGGPAAATVRIADNDPRPAASVNDVRVVEGDQGTTDVVFTVRLDGGPTALPININYATSRGTAYAGADYQERSGSITFQPGETVKTIAVPVIGDTLGERDEFFYLSITGNGFVTIADPFGIANIQDNDLNPLNVVISELRFRGATGVQDEFVELSNNSDAPLTVATADGSAGWALVGGDNAVRFVVPAGTIIPARGHYLIANANGYSLGGYPAARGATATPDATYTANITDSSGVALFRTSNPANFNFANRLDAVGFGNDLVGQRADLYYEAGSLRATGVTTDGEYSFVRKRLPSGLLQDTDYNSEDFVFVSTTVGDLRFDITPLGAPGPENLAGPVARAQLPVSLFDEAAAPNAAPNQSRAGSGDSGTLSIRRRVTNNTGAPVTHLRFRVLDLSTNGRTSFDIFPLADLRVADSADVNVTRTDGSSALVRGTTLEQPPAQPGGGGVNSTVAVAAVAPAAPLAPGASLDVQFLFNVVKEGNYIFDVEAQSDAPADAPTLQFAAANFAASESDSSVTVTVSRAGDASGPASVKYATSDGTASERTDYTPAIGTLNFAAGETSKTFDVLLTDDGRAETDETIRLTLSAPSGALQGTPAIATVTVADNDAQPPSSNPVDSSDLFVRQHYHDFLNREPDAEGLQFWINEIEQCGADAQCREVKRINVSAAFFLSIEFQETGFLAYRTYKAAYGDATSTGVPGKVPVIRLNEFLEDSRRIGQGVVVNVGNWQQQLEANKQAYALEFVRRQRFADAYPLSMTADAFVSKLDQNAGGVLSASEKAQLVAMLDSTPGDASKRAAVLRAVAEDADLRQAELNRAFVLMQYFGYLRRNPNDPQDSNFSGWKFWLDKLNQFNGNYVEAEMVKAFISSDEYRKRFGQ